MLCSPRSVSSARSRFFSSNLQVLIFLPALILFSAVRLSPADKHDYAWASHRAKLIAIDGAKPLGSEACDACHAEVAKDYRHAFHAQQGVGCEDCHGSGSLHVDAGGDVSKIISFSRRSAKDANAACLNCHVQREHLRNWFAGSHAKSDVRCTDCHQVHTKARQGAAALRVNFNSLRQDQLSPVDNLLGESRRVTESLTDSNENCLRCHQTQRGEISLPYHHPLREGKVGCKDCHDAHGGPTGRNLRTANINQLCISCHAQYRGPFAYQHAPVNENCLICHTPHGSVNTNLLLLSQPALCVQCHADHHNGANLPLADRCTGCHSSVHGADVATATGGSVFMDKGPFGVPRQPAQSPLPVPVSGRVPARASAAPLSAASVFAGTSLLMGLFGDTPKSGSSETVGENSASASSIAGSYRLLGTSGFAGRVGEYDSLQQSAGGEVQSAFISLGHKIAMTSNATILSAEDYRVVSQFIVSERFRAGFDVRSFLQQQDTHPFYAAAIDAPAADIFVTQGIPNGSVYAVERRLGNAYGRFQVPKLPVELFVKGNWQARVGHAQLGYFDMGSPDGDGQCSNCHYTSQFQSLNYTTRNISGGAQVNLGQAAIIWEHAYSSFNDRLEFPAGAFGATLNSEEGVSAGGVPIPDTLPGNYYLDIPAPNESSSDLVRLNWLFSPRLLLNGDVAYTRATNSFLNHKQNSFDANTTLSLNPWERMRFTLDYHQQNLINNFVPYYSLYGNVSYHNYWLGARSEYKLTPHFNVEVFYRHSAITRSNSALWPQAYSPDNTDRLLVVPQTRSNTGGLALRYRQGSLWSLRTGYEFTGTDAPGYLTVPGSNSRFFVDASWMPVRWLILTNDLSATFQNAFSAIDRRDRFYFETFNLSMPFSQNTNFSLGYSYQQNKLNSYMAFQNDAAAGYVIQEPFVPYNQLSQTYWGEFSSRHFQDRIGINGRFTYNSARSYMKPNLNPNDAGLLGNTDLINQGLFDPVLFQQALNAVDLGSTQVSQVIVPQWIGQAKVYYRLPRQFDAGLLFSYGSYRDYWNPSLNGVLRSYVIYVGRSW